MPNTTVGEKGCFCNPGYFWDYYPGMATDTSAYDNMTCVVTLVLNCSNRSTIAGLRSQSQQVLMQGTGPNCTMYVNVTRNGSDCPGYTVCKERRGTPQNPCTPCPMNSDSPAGSISRDECSCQVTSRVQQPCLES